MSKRPSATGPENALMQVVVKAAYDLRMAQHRFRLRKLSFISQPEGERTLLASKQLVIANAKATTVKETVTAILHICAAMPPVHRRTYWCAFRSGYRCAGAVIKQGGVL
jgi:hypothetical protein